MSWVIASIPGQGRGEHRRWVRIAALLLAEVCFFMKGWSRTGKAYEV